MITELIHQKGFDGIVWDTPYNFFEMSRSSINGLITDFLVGLRSGMDSLKGERQILFNMGSPIDHMTTLDIANYKRLPIDRLLVQNYDKGGRFLQVIDKAIQWKRDNRIDFPMILMLPFFSVTDTGHPMSTQDVTQIFRERGFASNRMSHGMCLMSTKNKRRFYVPCYSYFK